ncbi:MAG: hypothetical protein F6K28_50880 [Microcoleus sp. SIO2G3]|nr:hypothetical protein [Microcoleus sp. SIO2G3]
MMQSLPKNFTGTHQTQINTPNYLRKSTEVAPCRESQLKHDCFPAAKLTIPSPSTQSSTPTASEVPAQPTVAGLPEATVIKILDYGGFTAIFFMLSAFFWVLTGFVKEVKED